MRWRRPTEEELDRDIEEHLAMETEDNIARGMSPREARYAALRKFGNVARVKEETRSVWGGFSLDTLPADVRYAFRRIGRAPGTAALAAFSLALAFAPSVTMFSVMDRLFLTPVPVKAPQEIVEIEFRDSRPAAAHPYQRVSYTEFQDFRRSLASFSGMAYQRGQGAMLALNGRRILAGASLVSDNYFQVLGIPIQLGPGFSSGRTGLVISHSLWQREFGGRPDVIGATLLVTGHAFTIDGVAPPGFLGTANVNLLSPDLWIPLETWLRVQPASRSFIERRDAREGQVWARLRPGLTPAQALVEVQSVARDMANQWPQTNRYLDGYAWAALADHSRGGRNMTIIGVLILGILLAVACANIAGILLAQAEERRHEIAVRQSLGASRARLVREWMIESTVLALLGSGLGLAAAHILIDLVPRLAPSFPIPLNLEFSIGPRVWLYALALACVSTLAFGLVPAWRGSRPDLLSGLRRDTAVHLLHIRVPVRSLLIVAQVAAAEILLFGAGLVLDSLSAVRRIDPGFDPRRPVAIAMLLATAEGGDVRPADCELVRDRLTRIPGVRRVAYGKSVPVSGSIGPTVRMEAPGQEPRDIPGGSAGPGFLSLLGVRILSGRDFLPADQHAILVNATLARALAPAGDVVGREIRIDGNIRQIAGVFQDTAWSSPRDPAQPRVLALTSARQAEVTFAIEVDGDPAAYAPVLRSEVAAAQPGAMVVAPKTLWSHYQESIFLERTGTQALYLLGLLALLLTASGLHGIASALFARRSREFAIRLAMGASPRQIMGLVLSGGLALTASGLALGLAIAIPGALVLGSHERSISPWSIPAFGLSCAIVILSAVTAALQPAGRVFHIQPADIVRAE